MDNLIKTNGGGVKYSITDVILSDKSTYNEPYKRKTTIKGNIKGHKFMYMQFGSWSGANHVDIYKFDIVGGSVIYRPSRYGVGEINYVQNNDSNTCCAMSSGIFTAEEDEVTITYCYGNHFPAYDTSDYGLKSLLVALYEWYLFYYLYF